MTAEFNTSSQTNNKSEVINNGFVWYAALIPGLALFIETFALNKYMGFLIWGLVLVLRPLCCIIDRNLLIKKGRLSCHIAWALFPTVYIFKRCMAIKNNMVMAVICVICLSYGAIGNGFTTSLFINDETIVNAVKDNSLTSLSGLKDQSSADSISSAAEKAMSDITYSIVTDGDERYVTISGVSKNNGDNIEITVKVVHDGFTYISLGLEKFCKNGEEITDDERKEMLKELFSASIQSKSTDSSSSKDQQ